MADKLKITQVRSTIRKPERQKRTMAALGLRRMHQTVEHDDNPQIRGMLVRVAHLVSVEQAPPTRRTAQKKEEPAAEVIGATAAREAEAAPKPKAKPAAKKTSKSAAKKTAKKAETAKPKAKTATKKKTATKSKAKTASKTKSKTASKAKSKTATKSKRSSSAKGGDSD